MNITYHKQELSEILRDLSTLTGARICFADPNFHFILEEGERSVYCASLQKLKPFFEKCKYDDAELFMQCQTSCGPICRLCHGGLYNAATPVIKNDVIAGYIIIGCLRTSHSPQEPPYLTSSSDTLLDQYNHQPFFTDEQLESLMRLLPRILLQNAIQIEYDSIITRATDYISVNLSKKISIQDLCHELHVSKNHLYASFHAYYNCAVNEYINQQRIKKAQMLLKETSEPVYQISEIVGIENYTYFCKLFKQLTGISPGRYRNLSSIENNTSPE